jgi:hypothetical protein
MPRPRRRRLESEQALQRAVADYLHWAFPPGSGVEWTAFPAGGGGRTRGAILKGMGLKPGWPDLQFVYQGRYYGIELKWEKRGRSLAQIARHTALRGQGCPVATANSAEAVETILRGWGLPVHATLGGHLPETLARLAS